MRYSRFLTVSLLCFVTASLYSQMTPNAPIKNFRLPRFGDNGYTMWMLQGDQGIYDKDEQVSVKQMAMRIYSGDERMALELSMDSPQGTLLFAKKTEATPKVLSRLSGRISKSLVLVGSGRATLRKS